MADFKSVRTRQHHVEDEQVKGLFGGASQAVGAVLRRFDDMALGPQQIADDEDDSWFVVHENKRARSLRGR